jgi:hypothetical protein
LLVKVFISWSGETSRQIAEALRDWLETAMHPVKFYMSDRDNPTGVRWEGKVRPNSPPPTSGFCA